MTPARLAAIKVLAALDTERTTLAQEVERERHDLADRRDRALFFEMVTGVTRWRAALDARLSPFCRQAVSDLAPELRAILRLAVYQLHHLDRVPVHAIVNESVEAARALKQNRATGFINAALRNLVRAQSSPSPLPARPKDPDNRDAALAYLSVTLSHPRWLVGRWLDRVGFEACERWCDFNNAIPDVAVRGVSLDAQALRARLEAEGIDFVAGDYVSEAVRLRPGSLSRLSPETASHLFVQDEASQLVATLAGARPGERILDVCASPGGKTLILEQGAGRDGLVVSADRSARVGLLRSTLTRASAPVRVLALDAAAPLPFDAVFDRVLLDAPCSGLGTVSRDPDIKWHRTENDLARFAATQQRMLAAAATVVRPGGSLIYATCSSEPVENEGVIDRFLARTPGFSLAPLDTAGVLDKAARTIDTRGMMRTLPFRDGLDAFFAARLVRRDSA